MSFANLISEYIFVLATAASLILLIYLLTRRKVNGAVPLIFLLATSLLWMTSALGETGAITLEESVFWHKFGEMSFVWTAFSWFIFCLRFISRHKKTAWPRYLLTAGLVSLLFTLLIWTNETHHLVWVAFERSQQAPFAPLISILGPAGVACKIFEYGIGSVMLVLLIQELLGKQQQWQKILVLILCTALPGTVRLIQLLTDGAFREVNPTPYIYVSTLSLLLIGLVRYRLLNIFPIPYPRVIAGMRDGMLVIDLDNRIAHVNPAAETILMHSSREIIHLPFSQALSDYPELLACCSRDCEEVWETLTLNAGLFSDCYELHISALRDRYGYMIGKLITLHNITKQVQAENTSQQNQLLLKQSEEKYRSLVENINEVIFTLDTQHIFTYVSPVVERNIGYVPKQLIGKAFRDFVFTQDISGVEESIEQALMTSQMQVLSFRMPDQHGNIHHARASIRPIQQNDQIIGVQGMLSDMTESLQVEEALQRRASQLAMLNYIGEQIAAVIELNSVLDSATRLIQRHFGYYHVAIFTPDYDRGELLLRSTSGSFSELFPRDHRLKFWQGMVGWVAMNKNILLANDVRLEPRYTNLYPDKILTRSELAVPILVGDKMVGILDIQSPLVNAFDDNDVRVIKTVADQIAIAMENARLYDEVRRQLRERERKENMLRIQRDLLVRLSSAKRLDETLQIAIETLSGELHAKRAALSLVDWANQCIQPVAFMGYACEGPTHPIPLEACASGWVAKSAQPILISDAATEAHRFSMHPGTLSLLCAPLISNSKVIGVISLESDVINSFSADDLRLLTTLSNSLVMLIERARLFEEVEQARAELENRATALEEANASLLELDRLKSQFLANISHELRTPLNSIIGFSEVLIDEIPGTVNGEQQEFLQDILDSGKHLLALINDLLDFSKIEAGRMTLEPTTFEVKSLFDELRMTVAPLIDRKSQVLVFRQDGSIPHLTADHLRIKQVFINLLSNANKFTPEGGVITASCQLVDPETLLFTIQDTGIGIRPEDQELIFEEFRQVDGSMTREVAGSGLGLAISKQIVEMHHGKIWVESQLGHGAAFFIRLPVCCLTNLA